MRPHLASLALGLAALLASPLAAAHPCDPRAAPSDERSCAAHDRSARKSLPVTIRLGVFQSYARTATRRFDATSGDEAPNYLPVASRRFGAGAWFVGPTWGFSWLPLPFLSLGVDMRLGFGFGSFDAFSTRGVKLRPSGPHSLMDLLPSVGVRLPLGRVSIRPELGGGLRSVTFQMKSFDAKSGRRTWDAVSRKLALEPRLATDAWVTPNVTLSASGSVDPLLGDVTFALAFGYHGRAFDGRRSF